MSSANSFPEPSSKTHIKGRQADLELLINDSRNIYYLWFTSLVLMLSMMILHQHINVLIFVVITTFLFIYLWVLLLAKLDQLACRIMKISHNLVYLTLLIPVLGTLSCYHFIQYHADQITRNSH